ncbi:hypothetical protein BU26DRAFT_563098 [Trematosphaeria pertusa]|uniref:Uncharacterized protein n=1 Tax=Trematosphaeria pertusa TaxID=390896 RepID=A0A6A6INU0_9PLEO|nr:uncharacterized protein BU26DRAFT_563098 [Trematosphaeria pertusa]KAF2251153.1 hypothetical protein BU26DRAFT_563098 [Trematosphaeria pertusa]
MTSKADIIEERKANLPLPEQPPKASDWNSADERTVNVGAGGQETGLSHSGLGSENLREPATSDEVGSTGRQAKDGLSGIPNDAVSREKKDHKGLAQTTGKDYGYPQKNDPSSGLK